MKIINTKNAPAAVGPYVQARQSGNFLFTSGQVGLNPDTGAFAGEDVGAQATQVLANLEAVLVAAGAGKNSVIKVTIFLTDMGDFGVVNQIYGDFFGDHLPARSTVEVAGLPLNAKVEMEIIAEIN